MFESNGLLNGMVSIKPNKLKYKGIPLVQISFFPVLPIPYGFSFLTLETNSKLFFYLFPWHLNFFLITDVDIDNIIKDQVPQQLMIVGHKISDSKFNDNMDL